MNIEKNEIVTSVTTKLIEDAIKNGWEKIKKLFKDLDAKEQIKYRNAYLKYLENTKNKYSKIKTIIYRNDPIIRNYR